MASACGDDGGTEAVPDAGVDAMTSACTYTGFAPTTEATERDVELEVLFYTARSGAAPSIEIFTYDLYFSLGATDGVHEFTFTGQSLADCHTCVQMRRDCGSNTCLDGKKFLAQSGSVSVTEIGPAGTALQATFTDVKLAEITLGPNLSTTVVPGGETWCIDNYSLNQTITAP